MERLTLNGRLELSKIIIKRKRLWWYPFRGCQSNFRPLSCSLQWKKKIKEAEATAQIWSWTGCFLWSQWETTPWVQLCQSVISLEMNISLTLSCTLLWEWKSQSPVKCSRSQQETVSKGQYSYSYSHPLPRLCPHSFLREVWFYFILHALIREFYFILKSQQFLNGTPLCGNK